MKDHAKGLRKAFLNALQFPEPPSSYRIEIEHSVGPLIWPSAPHPRPIPSSLPKVSPLRTFWRDLRNTF